MLAVVPISSSRHRAKEERRTASLRIPSLDSVRFVLADMLIGMPDEIRSLSVANRTVRELFRNGIHRQLRPNTNKSKADIRTQRITPIINCGRLGWLVWVCIILQNCRHLNVPGNAGCAKSRHGRSKFSCGLPGTTSLTLAR